MGLERLHFVRTARHAIHSCRLLGLLLDSGALASVLRVAVLLVDLQLVAADHAGRLHISCACSGLKLFGFK